MNFDARKDYRQAVKFYQANVVSKGDSEKVDTAAGGTAGGNKNKGEGATAGGAIIAKQ